MSGSGYPYGGNPPQYPPPQNQIYPQLYNPTNAPPPTAMSYPMPGQTPGFPPQPSFAPGYPGGFPAQTGQPATMGYPGPIPTAPPFGFGYTNTTNQHPSSIGAVEWIQSDPRMAVGLSDRAVVAGYEGHDKSPLWIIRSLHEGDLIPGKLAIKHHSAYVAWSGKEISVNNVEVCCAHPNRVRWVEASNGTVPAGAVQGGHTSSGETLYIGRAKHQGSLTPGKVHPSHNVMYMSFDGLEWPHKCYEVLCTV